MKVFRPNSLTKPDNDHPLCNMREVQKAFFLFMAPVRQQRPWDLSPELVWDYLIECEWFEPTQRPFRVLQEISSPAVFCYAYSHFGDP